MKEHGLVKNSIKFFPSKNEELPSGESGIIPDQEDAPQVEITNLEDSIVHIKVEKADKKCKKKNKKHEIESEVVSVNEHPDLNSTDDHHRSRKRKRDSITGEKDISVSESAVDHSISKSPKHKRRKKFKDTSMDFPVTEVKEEVMSENKLLEVIHVGSSSKMKKKRKKINKL